jgi:hypothetical protein
MMVKVLFHGTSTKFKSSIMKHGLQPRGNKNRSTYKGKLASDPDRVYLTDVYALHFAALAVEQHGGSPLIVRALINPSRLLPDTDFEEGGLHSLKFESNQWEDCLRRTGCLSVQGTIGLFDESEDDRGVNKLYVINKKVWSEICDNLTRIETNLRHRAFHEIHDNQQEYALAMTNQIWEYRHGCWERNY